MSKNYLTVLFVFCILSVTAFGADVTWDGGGVGDRWLTPENWNTDAIPGAADRVFLTGAGETVLIEEGDDVSCLKILGPCRAGDEGTVTLKITGGSLYNPNYWYYANEPFGIGIVDIEGVDTTVTTREIALGYSGGVGYLNVTDGELIVYGTGGVKLPRYDDLQLSEAYLNIDGEGLVITEIFAMYTGGVVDCNDNGVLQIAGDQTGDIATYISNGWITAENGTATPLYRTDGGNTYVMSPNNNDLLVKAWYPDPPNGSFVPEPRVTLTWQPGEYADKHNVYFGTDEEALVLVAENLEVTEYDTGALDFATEYFWRIDEVNGLDTWTGNLWSFTTRGTLALEEFETYPADPNLLNVWSTNGGASIALSSDPAMDSQAMQLTYENSLAPYYSEAYFSPSFTDFTLYGIVSMDVWYYGNAANSAESMYAVLSDGTNVSVVQSSDPNMTQSESWEVWHIALTDFTDVNPSLDLSSISSVKVGIGDGISPSAGGSGTMYIDQIRLWEPRCFESPTADLDGDCDVDFEDFSQMASEWLLNGMWP